MANNDGSVNLIRKVSDLAALTAERLVPGPLLGVVDRTLVDVACVTGGGIATVADELRVDVPAVDAWRTMGVPSEFRPRLTEIAVTPPLVRGVA